MINFFSETDFTLTDHDHLTDWIEATILREGFELGEISYVFCNDEFLHDINVRYLDHDTYTDIISFDYSMGKEVHGEIYISVERVEENALEYGVSFLDELHRVMIHGVLHYCGYKDKSERDEMEMREAEDRALAGRDFL